MRLKYMIVNLDSVYLSWLDILLLPKVHFKKYLLPQTYESTIKLCVILKQSILNDTHPNFCVNIRILSQIK